MRLTTSSSCRTPERTRADLLTDAADALRTQLKEDEAELEQADLEAEIADLKRRRDSLRLFDFSGRNELRHRIATLKEQRDRARQAARERLAARAEELKQLEKRLEEIDAKIAREGAEDWRPMQSSVCDAEGCSHRGAPWFAHLVMGGESRHTPREHPSAARAP